MHGWTPPPLGQNKLSLSLSLSLPKKQPRRRWPNLSGPQFFPGGFLFSAGEEEGKSVRPTHTSSSFSTGDFSYLKRNITVRYISTLLSPKKMAKAHVDFANWKGSREKEKGQLNSIFLKTLHWRRNIRVSRASSSICIRLCFNVHCAHGHRRKKTRRRMFFECFLCTRDSNFSFPPFFSLFAKLECAQLHHSSSPFAIASALGLGWAAACLVRNPRTAREEARR